VSDPILHLRLYGRRPGLNEIVSADRTARMAGARLKANEMRAVALAARNLKPIPGGFWLFVWMEPNRRRDPDNIAAGGVKVIFDGLQDAGIIRRDGWEQVRGLLNAQVIDKARPGVLVECYAHADDCAAAWLEWEGKRE